LRPDEETLMLFVEANFGKRDRERKKPLGSLYSGVDINILIG
jgi:hypothetical protein